MILRLTHPFQYDEVFVAKPVCQEQPHTPHEVVYDSFPFVFRLIHVSLQPLLARLASGRIPTVL